MTLEKYNKKTFRSRLVRDDDDNDDIEDDLGGTGTRTFYSHKIHGKENEYERDAVRHFDFFLVHLSRPVVNSYIVSAYTKKAT